MLEKFSQIAEQAAKSVSRRDFLGRFGRAAVAAATAAAGLLALPQDASGVPRGTLCSGTCSAFTCVNNVVGGQCGNSKCVAIRGAYDSFGRPCCTCRSHNPGNPRH